MNLINQAACRDYLLECARKRWPSGKMTRVSQKAFDSLNNDTQACIHAMINRHDNLGKTVIPAYPTQRIKEYLPLF